MQKTSFSGLLLVCVIFAGSLYAQSFKDSDYFIEGGLRYGKPLYHPKHDTYLKDLYFGSAEIRFGKQTTGANIWERPLNNPIIGLAFRFTDYAAARDILGRHIAVFGYLQHPVIRWRWFTWHYQLGMGLGYFTKIYDGAQNSKNDLFALHITPYVNFQSGFDFRLNRQFDLCFNGNFAHSSNASMQRPNYGLNEVQGIVSLRYHLNPNIPKAAISADEKFKPANVLFATVDPGWLWARYDNYYYFKTGASIGYLRQIHPVFNAGAAFEICYMKRLGKTRDGDHNGFDGQTDYPEHSHTESIYGFGELAFGRFAFHVGIGQYLNKTPNNKELAKDRDGGGTLRKIPWQYEKIGFKIYLGNERKHFVATALRAYFPVADYLAFTYGYKFYTF